MPASELKKANPKRVRATGQRVSPHVVEPLASVRPSPVACHPCPLRRHVLATLRSSPAR